MKVVLLAAGCSIRMQPIQDKIFLRFLGKPLIENKIAGLRKAGLKEILVMGGGHNIRALRKLHTLVREQKNLELGMAGALLSAAPWIKNEPFLLMSCNDVVDPALYRTFRKSIQKTEGLILAKKVSQYFPGGYLKLNRRGIITHIVEKPRPGREPSKLVNIVFHYHPYPEALMGALKRIVSREDDRYERALQRLFDSGIGYRAFSFEGFWQPLKYPWHVLDLMNYFLTRLTHDFHPSLGGRTAYRKQKISISPSAALRGKVFLAPGVRILDNAVIQGPVYIGENTVIGTNVLVRESHIGANGVIGFCSEIVRSYLGDGVCTHTNYIGDSIIGSDVSFGAGTVTGNLRLDKKNIFVNIRKEKINTGRNKLGLFTGDHIRVGINTSFMPGVKIGSYTFVGAGITVHEDIPEGMFATGEWKLKIKPNEAVVV